MILAALGALRHDVQLECTQRGGEPVLGVHDRYHAFWSGVVFDGRSNARGICKGANLGRRSGGKWRAFLHLAKASALNPSAARAFLKASGVLTRVIACP